MHVLFELLVLPSALPVVFEVDPVQQQWSLAHVLCSLHRLCEGRVFVEYSWQNHLSDQSENVLTCIQQEDLMRLSEILCILLWEVSR